MSAEFEAQILADLRRTHAQLKAGHTMTTHAPAWSMRLTIEEVDLLLAIVDERDELKRRLLTDWEPDLPAGVNAGPATTASPADCPFVDTVHDCPLGGCPTPVSREAETPDLPLCGYRTWEAGTRTCVKPLGHGGKHLVDRRPEGEDGPPLLASTGREARETPPRWAQAGDGCTCLVNPNPYTHYGIVEPGDALDHDPGCPIHGDGTTPTDTPA